MTEGKIREWKHIHSIFKAELSNEQDNKISYESCDTQLSKKWLFQVIFNGTQELSSRDERNHLIAKNSALIKQKLTLVTNWSDPMQNQSIEDQIKSMCQRNMDLHQTYRKEFLGEPFELTEEKCDKEKNEDYETCEKRDDDTCEMYEVQNNDGVFKEFEESQMCSSVFLSNDSQYISAASEDLIGRAKTDNQDNDNIYSVEDDVVLKEDTEPSEKSVSIMKSFDPDPNCEDVLNGTEGHETGFIDCDQKWQFVDDRPCHSGQSDSHASDIDLKSEDMKGVHCYFNHLSSLTKICAAYRQDAKCEMEWNIKMSSIRDIGTSSFNESSEHKMFKVAVNMMHNIQDKEVIKKSPMSIDNRHLMSQSVDGKSQELNRFDPRKSGHSNFGESGMALSADKPRQRSGSQGKSRGRRHRSKRQKSGKSGKSGGGGSDSNNGRNSLDGDGGSSGACGGGNEDEDDGEKKGSGDRHTDEDEEDDDESDEDNKKDSDKKEVGTAGNLLPATAAVHDKAMDKDLTPLLSEDSKLPQQSSEFKGAFSWQMEEHYSIHSLLEELPLQTDMEEAVLEHSCISLDTLCDILGAASEEDSWPKEDIFLSLNPCLTVLTHNMSLAYEGDATVQDCQHCSFLALLLKHLANCDTNSSNCTACMQGYNVILHHTRICIETKRLASPCSRMDLCFKLCQSAQWCVKGLFDSNKIYNKIMIRKYCNKVLTLPFNKEVFNSETSVKDIGDEQPPEEQFPEEEIEQAESGPKLEQSIVVAANDAKPSTGPGQNTLRSSGSHTKLSRKPSTSRRNMIPPPITEHEEEGEEDGDGEKDKEGETKTSDDSAEAILRRKFGPKPEGAAANYTERENIYSLPQGGRINDQMQFNSLVSEAKGVKGVGEVVYSNVAQLRLVSDYWDQKKEEYNTTRKRPYQRAEEGVILEKYKNKFQILGTRYQLDYQWHKLTSLGSGMTGRCYLAMDMKTNFKFCVKKISLVDYSKEELCLWSDLNHSNIVTLYGAIRHSDIIYLFSEYIDGGDLGHCIDEHKSQGERLSHWLALRYFQQLLNIMLYLQSKNLLHEDIKADNLLLRAESFEIVLTDFGLCHRLQKAVEFENKPPAGTPTHFSPEKAASMGHGFPADVWACVCVLVHMLSGQQPWHKYLKKVDYLNFTIYMKPPPLDDVPDNIRAIVKDLIAQGFIKDPVTRPDAHKLLQHEAFNIINQEKETYFSALASGFHSNVCITSRATKDIKEVPTARGIQKNHEEEEVSLYEISLPQSAGNRLSSGLAPKPQLENSIIPQRMNTDYHEVEIGDDMGDDDKLGEATGGDFLSVNVENRTKEKIDSPEILPNQWTYSLQPTGTGETVQNSQVNLPDFNMLLQGWDDCTRIFLTDTTSANALGNNLSETLEVYTPSTTRNSNSDQIPHLSIFDHSSSGEINSSELFAPGENKEVHSQVTVGNNAHPKHFIEKKPEALRLNVVHSPLKHQGSKEKLTMSSSRKSNSTSTAGTTSSTDESVFFPGSATGSGARGGRDFKDFFGSVNSEDHGDKAQEENENQKKIRRTIKSLQENIDEKSLGGVKLTLYDEIGEVMMTYRMTEKEKQLPVRYLISDFKNKITFKHFELKKMDGDEINYNQRLKFFELLVMALPETKNCLCAGCQF